MEKTTDAAMEIERSRKLLQDQIAATEAQLRKLKLDLAKLDRQSHEQEKTGFETVNGHHEEENQEDENQPLNTPRWPLLQEEYRRYGRQMIVDQVGLEGQLKLRGASVILVGAGGLGCPAALYLAGAGVGTIGLIDGDVVEHSNLHRQVLHRTRNTGKFKVDSAIEYLRELNAHPKYVPYRKHLSPEEAPDIFSQFDVILDCTDNPATRYLISDTAVLLGKPLVSASALRTEGQLMVLNYPARAPGEESGGPCYRCVFPKPPPADSVVSCADGGILGPVVGMMGVMQALETIRVITLPVHPETHTTSIVPSLHLFSAYSSPPFRSIRLRRRRANCAVCSAKASISLESLKSGSMDYVQFCGSLNATSILGPDERMSAAEYAEVYGSSSTGKSEEQILIDVRERVQYDICAIQKSVNIPISEILSSSRATAGKSQGSDDATEAVIFHPWTQLLQSRTERDPIHVVCRQGNDSQAAVKVLKEMGIGGKGKRFIRDIKGGLDAWRREVDPEFPDY